MEHGFQFGVLVFTRESFITSGPGPAIANIKCKHDTSLYVEKLLTGTSTLLSESQLPVLKVDALARFWLAIPLNCGITLWHELFLGN